MTNFIIMAVLDSTEQLIKDMIPVFGKCSKTRLPNQPKGIPAAMYKLKYCVEGSYTNEQLLNMIPTDIRDKYGINRLAISVIDSSDTNDKSGDSAPKSSLGSMLSAATGSK